MIRALLIFFLVVITQGAFVMDEECLNYTIYPVEYELSISPYISNDRSFYDCHISITVIANAPNIQVIELDAKNMSISGDSIKVMKGEHDIVNKPRPYVYDRERGKLYIYLYEPLLAFQGRFTQKYVIRMSFRKDVTYDSTGIFLVRYVDEHQQAKYMLQTRLSPDNAKYFIPCFDNPRFESIFKITVYEPPKGRYNQHSNTSLTISAEQKREMLSDRRVKVNYVPSAQIALYQLGFHFSTYSFVQITSQRTNDNLIIWAPAEETKNCFYLLNFGETILNLIQDYSMLNQSVVSGPINIVGVPAYLNGYEIGSWNLLTNNVIRVIYRPEYISIKQAERMEFELAHQLSRIWLGNPGEVMRTRWNEEWFKEGMATYLAYYFLAKFDQGAQLDTKLRQPLDQYGLRMKHLAMLHDWRHTTPPLINFNDELAVNIPNRYKELVTMKTASLLWMVENWLGAEKFHQALVKYINSRRGLKVSLKDFMTSLDYDTVECFHQFFNGSTASKILNSWFKHAGYPVIDVYVMRRPDGSAVQLKQRRFSFTHENRLESDYLIPISYVIQNMSDCYNCYQPKFTIGRTYTFKEKLNNGWIILNRKASGYYRVNYDEETWRLIAHTLKHDIILIDEFNRAQIVNDVFALYAAGDMSQHLAMTVLDYLDQEKSPVVWEAAMSGYHMLRIEHAGCHMTKIIYKEWQAFLRRKVVEIYRVLTSSTDISPKARLFRSNILEFACELKYQKCWDYTMALHKQHLTKNIRVDPDGRTACYYMLYNTAKGITDAEKLNAFETEDRLYAEELYRRESNFFMKIPNGQPRPENMSMSTVKPWVYDKNPTHEAYKDKSELVLSSTFTIYLTVLSVLALR